MVRVALCGRQGQLLNRPHVLRKLGLPWSAGSDTNPVLSASARLNAKHGPGFHHHFRALTAYPTETIPATSAKVQTRATSQNMQSKAMALRYDSALMTLSRHRNP